MMFQGSANADKGMHFATVESNGGVMNGSTHPDFTDYYETLPSNKLGTALWLESDRMRSLAITDANLTNQKEAVKQERRLNFDNQPYATAIVDVWPTLVFKNWQSSHSLIGSCEDLNAATVDDVSKFFKTYYAPNNAVLVIVGDLQDSRGEEADRAVLRGHPVAAPAEEARARRARGIQERNARPQRPARPGAGSCDRVCGTEAPLARLLRD